LGKYFKIFLGVLQFSLFILFYNGFNELNPLQLLITFYNNLIYCKK